MLLDTREGWLQGACYTASEYMLQRLAARQVPGNTDL